MRKSKLFRFAFAFAIAIAFVSCTGGVVEKTSRGVIVRIENATEGAPSMVRLEVCGEKIIRVSATPEKKFADPQSLIIVDQEEQTPFDVAQHGDTVVVSTASLQANVLTTTGEVWFTDSVGEMYLREQIGGGKTFKPYQCTQTHADGKDETYKGWSSRIVFESPEDEAFYGLGQHQADEWNYKGRNEELFQYNTKVSIPFVVSSKNYGVLLDSYSLCRFGNPNPYEQLQRLFKLTDKEGVEGALTGTYTSPEAETLVRREDSLYFENLKSAKNLPQFPMNRATVVYEGTLEPLASGEYEFCHYYSGYQRIFIDGVDVYNEDVAGTGSNDQTIWRTAWNPNARKFRINLETGKKYAFRLEWTPDGGEAYCGLRAYAPVDPAEQQKLSLWSEMTKQLDYYFVAGDNSDEVIKGYRSLTGKAQIMPDWLLGYWQSRERYKTQDEILDALRGFRERHLPIDNIVMDWNYWVPDSWGAFEFDPERFSDPKGMIDTIHANNAKIMISCWPKYYLTVDNFKELDEKGMIYQQSVKDSIYDWLGYKYGFYDAYDETARKIFWRQLYEKLGTIGMDAWWMDASEPNVRDCTDLEYRKLLCGPTKYGSSDEFFNAYSIVNAEAIYDGQRAYESAIEKKDIKAEDSKTLQADTKWDQRGFGNEFSPENKRVFLLTRNGFASEQRYSTATWSGDIGTRWEDMKAQVTAGLNFSISGVPYWSQDIGGFSVEKRYEAAQRLFDASGVENADLKDWRELNARWHEWGMWTPMYRSHGQFPFREPWNIAPEGHPAYEAIKACLELRYHLLPYIYSLAADVHFNDYTIMRPMVMDFGKDKNVLNIGYQYMFGPAFMINPVYTYKARSREVYFPQNTVWYDFFTGAVASNGGEKKTVAAPYGNIPVYVRGGSIIPVGPAMEYTQQKKAENIRLFVYEGADGDFTLYEDEGVNYGYEAGRYAKIRIKYDDTKKTVTICDRKGEFPGMLKNRKFTVVFVHKHNAVGYNPDVAGQEVTYTG
ncbi:MAG: glycoside hydrolase family 31 protein, partial [Prevotellaceae bacterium]|nr:glycoside hydrolase family 31 protein [Prevotellaceae bacterium]